MKTKEFISKLDEEKVVAAIAAAEKKTSGEIRVYISSKKRDDAMGAAQTRFEKLGMTKTKRRNGVLIYFVPLTRKFAIVGDAGIHEKCGQPFWEEVRDAMAAFLKKEQFTEAVLTAVGKVGELLAKHFPPDPNDKNELPDSIVREK
jgi:uncharacterized membrane protein